MTLALLQVPVTGDLQVRVEDPEVSVSRNAGEFVCGGGNAEAAERITILPSFGR
jgi:hypothetical protein